MTRPPFGVASSLNPDAGQHAVSTDPVEVEAGREATHRIFLEFPYYERRYGARGSRFGTSDSAWLATLCELEVEAAAAQVAWLCGVLGARGMPRYLMERHLRIYHGLLQEACPERRRYGALSHCADGLQAARIAAMPDASFFGLAYGHEQRACKAPEHVPNMGLVLVSAVLDECAGAPLAVQSVLDWAADPARFGKGWIAEVRQTLAEAREACRAEAREACRPEAREAR